MDNKKQYTGMLAALAGNIIFGLTFIFIRSMLVAGLPANIMLTWRLGIALFAMLILCAVGIFKLNLKGKRWRRLLPAALFSPCLYFLFESAGVSRTSASESGIIIALVPICVLILARILLKEQSCRLQVLSVIVSVFGVVLIILAQGGSATFSPSGYLFLFGAVLMAAGYILMVRQISDEFSSIEITISINLVGFIFFGLLGLGQSLQSGDFSAWLIPLHNTEILFGLLYLAIVSSIFAFIFINYSINVIGASRSSIFSGFNTLTSIIAGILMLNESLLFWQGVGDLLIILGVTGANYFALPRQKTETKKAV
jgi:drug/metabolite transporter (DMT)-like permease